MGAERGRVSARRLTQSELWAGWEELAREYIVRAMQERKLRYSDLSALLRSHGIVESADTLNRKVNRRRFSSAFFVACMSVMQYETLNIPTPKQVRDRFTPKS